MVLVWEFEVRVSLTRMVTLRSRVVAEHVVGTDAEQVVGSDGSLAVRR